MQVQKGWVISYRLYSLVVFWQGIFVDAVSRFSWIGASKIDGDLDILGPKMSSWWDQIKEGNWSVYYVSAAASARRQGDEKPTTTADAKARQGVSEPSVGI